MLVWFECVMVIVVLMFHGEFIYSSVCVHACNIMCVDACNIMCSQCVPGTRSRHTLRKKEEERKLKTSCNLRKAIAHQRCSFNLPTHTRSDPATLRSMLRRCIRVYSRPHFCCLHSRSRSSTTHFLQDARALQLTRRIPFMTKARVLPENSQNSVP